MREIEISIRGLMFFIFDRWISVLCGMLVFSLLFGGIKYFNDARKLQSSSVSDVNSISLRDEEKEYLEYLSRNINNLRKINLERKDSLVMRIDPENVAHEDITFIIRVNDPTELEGVKQVYDLFLEDIQFSGCLSEKTGMLVSDIVDIVSVNSISNNTESSTSSITISIVHETVEAADNIAKITKQILDEECNSLNEAGLVHSLFLVSEKKYQGPDSDLLQTQIEIATEIKNRDMLIIDNESGLKEEQRKYYDCITLYGGIDSGNVINETTQPVSYNLSLKHFGVGLIVGFCVISCFYVIVYILKNKLDEEDDVQKNYETSDFGTITGDDYGKLLYKLKHIGRKTLDFENSIELVAARINAFAQKENIEKIGIVGCGIEKNSQKASATLVQKLKERGVEAIIVDDPLYNPVNVIMLNEMHHVILLEKIGITNRTEIWKEEGLIKSLGIKLGGLVMVE